ncbi:TPA: zonular occludens toxin family protein, partial [Escherichia coli]
TVPEQQRQRIFQIMSAVTAKIFSLCTALMMLRARWKQELMPGQFCLNRRLLFCLFFLYCFLFISSLVFFCLFLIRRKKQNRHSSQRRYVPRRLRRRLMFRLYRRIKPLLRLLKSGA